MTEPTTIPPSFAQRAEAAWRAKEKDARDVQDAYQTLRAKRAAEILKERFSVTAPMFNRYSIVRVGELNFSAFQVFDDWVLHLECKCEDCGEIVWIEVHTLERIGELIEQGLMAPAYRHPGCKGDPYVSPFDPSPESKLADALKQIIREEIRDAMCNRFGE